MRRWWSRLSFGEEDYESHGLVVGCRVPPTWRRPRDVGRMLTLSRTALCDVYVAKTQKYTALALRARGCDTTAKTA